MPQATGKRPTHLHTRRGHMPGCRAALAQHVTAFKSGESHALKPQSQPAAVHVLPFHHENLCPQSECHGLGSCRGRNLAIERAVASEPSPRLLSCSPPTVEAESPLGELGTANIRVTRDGGPSSFCSLISPFQIRNPSILDPSVQLSQRDNSHVLVNYYLTLVPEGGDCTPRLSSQLPRRRSELSCCHVSPSCPFVPSTAPADNKKAKWKGPFLMALLPVGPGPQPRKS